MECIGDRPKKKRFQFQGKSGRVFICRGLSPCSRPFPPLQASMSQAATLARILLSSAKMYSPQSLPATPYYSTTTTGRYLARGSVRLSTATLGGRYGVHHTTPTGAGQEEGHSAVHGTSPVSPKRVISSIEPLLWCVLARVGVLPRILVSHPPLPRRHAGIRASEHACEAG